MCAALIAVFVYVLEIIIIIFFLKTVLTSDCERQFKPSLVPATLKSVHFLSLLHLKEPFSCQYWIKIVVA